MSAFIRVILSSLICPIFADGCEGVADAPFAWPFGIPDGYIGTVLYRVIAILLLAPAERWVWFALLVLSLLATFANIIGVMKLPRPTPGMRLQLSGKATWVTLSSSPPSWTNRRHQEARLWHESKPQR
jgi:hypothetical protein